MEKRYKFFRYLAYAIEILLVFIFQTTPQLLPEIGGSKPVLLIPVALTIAFFEEEILTRKLHIYPPYCDICVVWAQSSVREQAEDAINEIFSKIKEKLKEAKEQLEKYKLSKELSEIKNLKKYRMF